MTAQSILRTIASQLPTESWLVGGAVRDRLLGRSAGDLDLVLADRHSPLLQPEYWRAEGSEAFWLDQSLGLLRLLPAGGPSVDLAPLLAENLSSDLARRDFTVNAIAWPLSAWLAGEERLIDPWAGRADLQARQLRLVQADALTVDPVRVLRAVRLQLELSLTVAPQTGVACAAASTALSKAPGERVWQELSRILLHPQAASGLQQLDAWGVVAALFPEVTAMVGVSQNQYHQFTVDEHSRRAFAAYSELVQQGVCLDSIARQQFVSYWTGLDRSAQAAIMLAAWLHDIGKPGTRQLRQGRVTFYDHEHVGARLAAAVAGRLKLSRQQTELIHSFITWHMYPMQLWRTGHLDRRLIHRLFQRTGQCGVAIVLFTLADHLAKGEGIAASQQFAEHRQLVHRLLAVWSDEQEQVIQPRPLLTGDEIVSAAGKPAGPWVRSAKAALLEAQAAGEVVGRESALAFLQRYLAASQQHGGRRHSRRR